MWTLEIHTMNSDRSLHRDYERVASHDFTIFYAGIQVAFEPQDFENSQLTWGEVRQAVRTLNELSILKKNIIHSAK